MMRKAMTMSDEGLRLGGGGICCPKMAVTSLGVGMISLCARRVGGGARVSLPSGLSPCTLSGHYGTLSFPFRAPASSPTLFLK